MLAFMGRHKTLTTLAVLVLLLTLAASWSSSETIAAWRGRAAAKRDEHRDRFIQLGYGLAPPAGRNFATALHKRYPDAEFVTVAGCIVSRPLIAYVHAYNQYSEEATVRHFGHDIFAEARRDAQNDWNRTHPPIASRVE